MLVVIGSTALNHYHSVREPKDLDLLGSLKEASDYLKIFGYYSCYPIDNGNKYFFRTKLPNRIIELDITWKNSQAEKLFNFIINDPETIEKDGFLYPSLDILYLLKMSHRYLKNSPHFDKTRQDILLMRSLGAKIKPEHKDFLKARSKATYNYPHPKLNVDKKDFFKGDAIGYVYDHDSIHEAIKHLSYPAYTYFKDDKAEVFCSKSKFFSLEESYRLLAVLEESYVLALERSQIPYRGKISPDKSFKIALTKVCTSITSGWFREYAWEHWDEVYKLYDPNYAEKFFSLADSGLVKSYGG